MKKVGKYYPRTERDYKPTVIESERDEVNELRDQAIAQYFREGGTMQGLKAMLDKFNNDTQTHTT